MYKFISEDNRSLVHIPTSRCIYLDQPPTIHTEAYLAWVAEGNTPEPYVAPPPPPPQPPAPLRVEALQGLLALDTAGLSGAYTTWASSPDRTFAQRAFIDKAIHWRSDDPTLITAATDIGLTEAQIVQLFTLAATL